MWRSLRTYRVIVDKVYYVVREFDSPVSLSALIDHEAVEAADNNNALMIVLFGKQLFKVEGAVDPLS